MKNKNFTKADLKPRMVLETRCGMQFLYCGDDIILKTNEEKNGFERLSNYNDNLVSKFDSDFDIVKIFHPVGCIKVIEKQSMLCYWQREEPKQLTVSEIENILGYKVEIVAEKSNN